MTKRNAIILVVVAVVVAVVVLVSVVISGILFVEKMIMGSKPMVMTVQRLEADPQVTAVTGTPIHLTMSGRITIKEVNDSGTAEVDSTAVGPKGSMHFTAHLSETSGAWRFDQFTIYPGGVAVPESGGPEK
jgi:hypothetical protein